MVGMGRVAAEVSSMFFTLRDETGRDRQVKIG